MNAGSIWWGQIGNSLRLIQSIANALRDCRPAVLQVPSELPWRQDFYEAVDMKRAGFSGERRLVRLPWPGKTDPGQLILDELCSKKIQSEYWPGMSYAEYLSSLDDIVLNEYYVWITGIRSKSDLCMWEEFIRQYGSGFSDPSQRAVFLLEYEGAPCEFSGIEQISYSVEPYDCHVFCLETAAALNNTDLRDYQAQLALCIGEGDPELSAALLASGKDLLLDPVNTTKKVVAEQVHSNGKPFPEQADPQISSAAWDASIILLFPIMEHYRLNFISRYEAEISRHLPISNSNGDRITDPYDLEIGPLDHVVSSARKQFSADEAENIRLCHNARNRLAHNKPVPYMDALKILSLARKSDPV